MNERSTWPFTFWGLKYENGQWAIIPLLRIYEDMIEWRKWG